MHPALAAMRQQIEDDTLSPLPADETAILESIQTVADLTLVGVTLTDDGTGRYAALLASAGRALGLSAAEANQKADDLIPPAGGRRAAHVPPAPVEPIFGIGALNLGDGAEAPARWPQGGQVCKRCGQSEADGAMFTTVAGSGICDDCIG